MSRRKKNHPANDILEMFSLLPLWLCFACAVVSYFVLHHYATALTAQDIAGFAPGHMQDVVMKAVITAVANTGQYLVPGLFSVAAVMSLLRRSKRRKLVQDLEHSKAAQPLNDMNWREFEMLVGQGFRQQGYRVLENERAGPDGGVDLVLFKGGEKHLVQCKQWRAYRVGVEVVRELYGLMAASGAAGGFVVTSGRFTHEAQAFAEGRNIRLMDGTRLQRFFSKSTTRSVVAAQAQASSQQAERSDRGSASPLCPRCQSPMVRRVAKAGPDAGQAFFGCTNFPKCRATLPHPR